MHKIQEKKYLRIKFSLASPLVIGQGKNVNTDNDIVRDGSGTPYIPGSAVAGVTRQALKDSGISDSIISTYLGEIVKKTQNIKESRVIFYDALLTPESKQHYFVSIRDSVALDQYKNSKDGAKFDMEVLEPGVQFVTYIETDVLAGDEDDITCLIRDTFNSKNIRFGAKTTRGYGEISDINVSSCEFNLQTQEGLHSYINFDIYADDTEWKAESVDSVKNTDIAKLDLSLELVGGIFIRRYSTAVGDNKNKRPSPDYQQLTIQAKNGTEIPVIPGTTWAGAIKHRIDELIPGATSYITKEGSTQSYFGKVDGNYKQKSPVRFGESRIEGGSFKVMSRNAIDRFTGGTTDGALFTERSYYGGETHLVISLGRLGKGQSQYNDKFLRALSATLSDLHEGLLSVGGLTAVGKGIFRVKEINGEAFKGNGEELYQKLYCILCNKIKETA